MKPICLYCGDEFGGDNDYGYCSDECFDADGFLGDELPPEPAAEGADYAEEFAGL